MSVHTHTDASTVAIESPEREFAQRVRVDWNNNAQFDHPLSDLSAYVSRTKRDQTLTSTAPDEIMLIEGYSAAKLTVELVGEYDGLSLASHFAPYNGRSIFYTEGIALGVTMTYEIAVSTIDGWEWYPQFLGVVREVDADRDTGSVTMECLDNVERMRTSVDLPPYALWESYLQNGFKRGGLIDSSSVIDLAARSAGFTMGPDRWAVWEGEDASFAPRAGPILSVPLHGSVLPEIGMLDNAQSFHLTEQWQRSTDPAFVKRSEAYTRGPHGYLAHAAVPRGANDWNYKNYWIDEWDQQAGSAEGTWVLGCWIYWTGNGVDENSLVMDCQIRENHFELFVRNIDGGVEARLRETNGFLAYTDPRLYMTTPGWYYIEGNYLVENTGNYAMRVRVGDEYSAESRWSGRDARDINDRLSGLARLEHKYALSDAYVVKAGFLTSFASFTYDTTPHDTARVSWGRNRMAYTLRDSGREAWDLAKEVAAAEYGSVFFDEIGRFVSWNYRDMAGRQGSPVRTFTLDDLGKLSLRTTFDSVRNVWTVTTRTARALHGMAYDMASDGVPLWRNGDEYFPSDFRISPAEQEEVFFQVDDTLIAVTPWAVPDIGENGFWDQYAPLHARKSYQGDVYRGVGGYATTEQKLITRNMARMTIFNDWSESTIGFVGPQGQARFRVEGTEVQEDEPYTWTIRDDDSVAEYGQRVIELSDNFWLQDEFQTREMLSDIVSRMGRPIPVSDTLTVPGDPRIQLGDTVQVRDLEGFGERMWLQVYGIQREYGTDGLTDTYTVEMVTAAGVGEWDSLTYGLWDRSLIWS